MIVNRPKGTVDILPTEIDLWTYLESSIRKVCRLYNFKEIRTPIFESGELFHRNTTDVSDMVTKETYDFVDRGSRNITLRPEGTAGVVRAYIENKIYASQPLFKTFYMGPMFRYERPQKGRQRQFHQFGIELLGSNSPLADAEVISVAVSVIKKLGLKGIKVKINTIGDEESRDKYRDVLVNHFEKYTDSLCSDCNNRLHKNPLRILDCKVCSGKDFFKTAPKIKDYLNELSSTHFKQVLTALDDMNIEYQIDENLVRGLDYYTFTVFEIEVDVKDFGAQNVICAGGRYNNLVEQLGGPSTDACGLAFGMERLLLALELEKRVTLLPDSIHLYLISLGDRASKLAFKLLNNCRLSGLQSEMDYQGKTLKAQFKQADRYNAKFTAIIGDDEVDKDVINLKNNSTGEQITIQTNELISYLTSYFKKDSCSNCNK